MHPMLHVQVNVKEVRSKCRVVPKLNCASFKLYPVGIVGAGAGICTSAFF